MGASVVISGTWYQLTGQQWLDAKNKRSRYLAIYATLSVS